MGSWFIKHSNVERESPLMKMKRAYPANKTLDFEELDDFIKYVSYNIASYVQYTYCPQFCLQATRTANIEEELSFTSN